MRDFEFYNPCRVIFGRNSEKKLLYELRRDAKSVLFVYGGGSIKKSNLYDVISDQLREAGVGCQELGGIEPNPKIDKVRRGIEICKRSNVDFILAVGGGSVIDTAKAIAVGAEAERDVWDFYQLGLPVHRALPVGVVLTIAASGSECSSASVITNEQGIKRRLKSEAIIPRFALLNPERTESLSAYQTACGVCDIMSHLFERYMTTDDGEFVDRQIESGIVTLLKYGPIAIKSPSDYNARAEIMWCGTVAHNNSLSAGRNTDWGSHDIEFELSAMNGLAHGAGMSIVFPAWMKYNEKLMQKRLFTLACRAFDVEWGGKSDEQVVDEMIEKLIAFNRSIGLPVTLTEAGFIERDISTLCGNAFCDRDTIGAVVKMRKSDMANILKICL